MVVDPLARFPYVIQLVKFPISSKDLSTYGSLASKVRVRKAIVLRNLRLSSDRRTSVSRLMRLSSCSSVYVRSSLRMCLSSSISKTQRVITRLMLVAEDQEYAGVYERVQQIMKGTHCSDDRCVRG